MLQSIVQAFFNQALAGSRDRIDAGFQRGGDLAVAPSLAGVRGVGFQQNACFQLLPRRVLSLLDHRVQLVTFLVAERDDVFFDGDHFPGHESAPLLGAGSSSQRLAAESRTWGTAHQQRNVKIERRVLFNLRSLDLNLLTVFEAIYECGTVSGAAGRLALSQSATSHALSRLRDACRDDLFVRSRQGLSPTPVATDMYPTIKSALEALRTTLAEASGFDPLRSQRRFRISIPHPMGPFFAVALRAAAAAVAPDIVLTFDTVSRPVGLEDNLRDGLADIAIDWLPVMLDPFVNRKLFDDHVVLLARRDHPSAHPGITIEDLRKAEFVTLHRRREIRGQPRRRRTRRDVSKLQSNPTREAVRVSELLEIPTVVASSDLLGIFPSSMGPLMAERLGLQVFDLPLELPPIPIYMIWHETRRHDHAHNWLRELVVTELGRLASS